MAIVTDSPVVRIEFSVTDEAGEFRDAITLPFDEYRTTRRRTLTPLPTSATRTGKPL